MINILPPHVCTNLKEPHKESKCVKRNNTNKNVVITKWTSLLTDGSLMKHSWASVVKTFTQSQSGEPRPVTARLILWQDVFMRRSVSRYACFFFHAFIFHWALWMPTTSLINTHSDVHKGGQWGQLAPPSWPNCWKTHAKVPSWEPKCVLKCPLGSQNVC